MKFSQLALFLSACAVAGAQSISIVSPTEGENVKAGSTISIVVKEAVSSYSFV